MTHPARWTPAILDVIAPVLGRLGLPVHDPFAGTGERLGVLCDWLGLPYSGTEIEPEWITDPRVRAGDSTQPATYPAGPYVVTTSPVYPNGMADHFAAKDGSRRHTYRQALASLVGQDRPLSVANMGRYSVRGGRRAEARYWALARSAVRWWPSWAVVNVSDFIYRRDLYPLADRWGDVLAEGGYRVEDVHQVRTPRQRQGANGALRAEYETVLVAQRRGDLR